METQDSGPYRTGVRVCMEEPAEPLPDFLTKRFDDLVAERKKAWQATLAPTYWVNHVRDHVRDYEPEKRTTKPMPQFFLASVAWAFVTMGIPLLTLHAAGGDLGNTAFQNRSRVCGLLLLIITGCLWKFARRGLGWPVKVVGLPLVSLYLTGKEVVAWAHWQLGGRHWQDPARSPWKEEAAARAVIQHFRETVLDAQWKKICEFRSREREYREEIVGSEGRIKRYDTERAGTTVETVGIVSQLTHAIIHEQASARAYAAHADRLGTLAETGESLIKTIRRHLETYETLQDSRRRLRHAGKLAEDEMSDLTHLDLIRRTYLDLRLAVREGEAALRAPVVPTDTVEETESGTTHPTNTQAAAHT